MKLEKDIAYTLLTEEQLNELKDLTEELTDDDLEFILVMDKSKVVMEIVDLLEDRLLVVFTVHKGLADAEDFLGSSEMFKPKIDDSIVKATRIAKVLNYIIYSLLVLVLCAVFYVLLKGGV